MLHRASVRAWPTGCVLAGALTSVACSSPPPVVSGPDVFVTAALGTPTGALLSVWVPPTTDSLGGAVVVGGYTGVDPTTVTDGHIGRVVTYDGHGNFTTVCAAPHPLWWVDGLGDDVWAVGEAATLVHYARASRSCEVIPVPDQPGWTVGGTVVRPNFWGVFARATHDLYIVGGSILNGPELVLLHYDGSTFTQETLPTGLPPVQLFKVNPAGDGVIVVGERGVILERSPDGLWARALIQGMAPTGDNTLFTVSSTDGVTLAVGGSSSGLVVQRLSPLTWSVLSTGDFAGLSGVYAQSATRAYIVGGSGTTTRWEGGTDFYQPPPPSVALSAYSLHATHGNGSTILSVGGLLFENRVDTQFGVVLLREPSLRASYVFDGVSYAASGTLRP